MRARPQSAAEWGALVVVVPRTSADRVRAHSHPRPDSNGYARAAALANGARAFGSLAPDSRAATAAAAASTYGRRKTCFAPSLSGRRCCCWCSSDGAPRDACRRRRAHRPDTREEPLARTRKRLAHARTHERTHARTQARRRTHGRARGRTHTTHTHTHTHAAKTSSRPPSVVGTESVITQPPRRYGRRTNGLFRSRFSFFFFYFFFPIVFLNKIIITYSRRSTRERVTYFIIVRSTSCFSFFFFLRLTVYFRVS